MNTITHALLLELFHYDPLTGVFTRRVQRRQHKAGEIAGKLNADGYREIKINGRCYRAHRLAWLYVYEAWPDGMIDHRDNNRTNNCIDNLRLATQSQNQANKRVASHGLSGTKGVTWSHRTSKWEVRVGNNPRRYAGQFIRLEDAKEAYRRVAQEIFGEFARG